LRVAAAQIRPLLGDLGGNIEAHRRWIARARAEGVDLLVFPELSLTGYSLRDLAPEMVVPLRGGPLADLAREAGGMSVAVGCVVATKSGPPANAAALLEAGRVASVHRKVYLPNYGMFEEARYFTAGDRFRTHDSPTLGLRLGTLICRDLWHLTSASVLAARGMDLLIAMSASPGRDLSEGRGETGFGSTAILRTLNECIARFHQVFVVHANRVGTEEGVTFTGASEVRAPSGALLAEGPEGAEALVIADIDPGQLHRARSALTLVRDERRDLVLRELNHALRERGRTPDA
jgi:predicted amidohydrolase